MIEIVTSIDIQALPERVFDLSRDLQMHERITAWTSERVVESTAEALMEAGDVVTFEARHLGVTQRLTSKITAYDRPRSFTDEMQKGAFKSLRHEHLFEEIPAGTRLCGFRSALGIFGMGGREALLGRIHAATHRAAESGVEENRGRQTEKPPRLR